MKNRVQTGGIKMAVILDLVHSDLRYYVTGWSNLDKYIIYDSDTMLLKSVPAATIEENLATVQEVGSAMMQGCIFIKPSKVIAVRNDTMLCIYKYSEIYIAFKDDTKIHIVAKELGTLLNGKERNFYCNVVSLPYKEKGSDTVYIDLYYYQRRTAHLNVSNYIVEEKNAMQKLWRQYILW